MLVLFIIIHKLNELNKNFFFIAHKFAIHRRYLTSLLLSAFHLPLERVHSQPTAWFRMVFGIELALADCTFVHGALHGFPLFLGDFEFVDAPDIVDVTICHPRVHRHAAMGLERDSSYTGHFAGLGVEGAVRATRTTTFPKCD